MSQEPLLSDFAITSPAKVNVNASNASNYNTSPALFFNPTLCSVAILSNSPSLFPMQNLQVPMMDKKLRTSITLEKVLDTAFSNEQVMGST